MAVRTFPIRESDKEVEAVLARSEPQPLSAEDSIRGVLRVKRPLFEYCFNRELRTHASFNGFLLLRISVAVDGRITEVGVEEAGRRDRVVGSCMAAQLRGLTLPPPESEMELLLPIRLEAQPSPPAPTVQYAYEGAGT